LDASFSIFFLVGVYYQMLWSSKVIGMRFSAPVTKAGAIRL
jgi:hypothetical protein